MLNILLLLLIVCTITIYLIYSTNNIKILYRVVIISLFVILILILNRNMVKYFYYIKYIIREFLMNNENRMQVLINHARHNSPYYKQVLKNDIFTTSIPYLTKDIIIEYNDELITIPNKKCKLKCLNGCLFDSTIWDKHCLVGQSTGGTSGKSSFVWMSKTDSANYIASFLKSFRLNNWYYGERILVFYPTDSYFTNEYVKSNDYLWFMGVKFLSFNDIDILTCKKFVQCVNLYKPELLVIFPFVLIKLCLYIKKYDFKLKHIPKNINLSGEAVLTCSENFIKSVFIGTNIGVTYGAVEFGEIAHRIPGTQFDYDVFSNFGYVENDEIGRIVVTSYNNLSFPIIRYVMEDIGEVITKNGFQKIINFKGKITNIIDEINIDPIKLNFLINSFNCNNIVGAKISCDNIYNITIYYITDGLLDETMYDKVLNNTTEYFKNNTVKVFFTDDIKHNFLTKFRIIESTVIGSEPVGGFYKS